jgi:hypothetical protein
MIFRPICQIGTCRFPFLDSLSFDRAVKSIAAMRRFRPASAASCGYGNLMIAVVPVKTLLTNAPL